MKRLRREFGFLGRHGFAPVLMLLGAMPLSMSCGDEVREIIEAVTCETDEECVSGCDTICVDRPVISSDCNEDDGVCVCECGSDDQPSECVDGEVVQEPYPSSVACDPGDASGACESTCESTCTENGFTLGSVGASCSDTGFGAFCECTCAYCRPNAS